MTALWPALDSARAELGLRPLVAAQESSEHRRARVRLQLRDKYGRWIEMGGGVRWKANGKYLHGIVDGLGPALGDIPTVRVKTSAGTEVNVRHTDLETMKASINAPAPGKTSGFLKAEIKPEAFGRVLDYGDSIKAPDLKNGDIVHQTKELATGDLVTTGELYRIDGVKEVGHAGPYPRYAVTSTHLQSGKQYTNEVDDLQRYWKATDSDVRLDASAPDEEFNPHHDDTKFDEVINTDGSTSKLDKEAAGAPVDTSKTGVEAVLDEKQKGISDSLGNDKHGSEMRVGTEIKYPKKGAGLVTGTIESGAYDSPWLKVKRSNGVFDSVHKDNVTVQKKADAPQASPVSAKQTWFQNQPDLDPMHLEIKDPAVAEEWNNGDKFEGMSPVDKYAADNVTTYEVGAGYRRMVSGEQYKNWHGNGPAMETAVLLDAKSSGDGTYDPHNPQTGWGVFRFDDGREEIEFLSNFKGTKKYDRVAPNKENQNDDTTAPGPGAHAPGQEEEAPQPGVPGQTDVEGGRSGDHQGGSQEEANPADEVTYGPLQATEEEQRALAEYAALAQSKALGAYNVVNTELRKGDASHPSVALLDSAIEKAPPLEQETTVYRYVKSFTGQAVPSSTDTSSTYYSVIPGKMEPGTVLHDRGYMSTTREDLINSPGPGTGTVYFRIKLPAGTKAVDITAQDLNTSHPEYQYAGKDEQELLLGRGKYLRVVSDTGSPSIGSGQKRVVDVEVITADQINHEEAQSADIENIRTPLLRSRETVLARVNDEVAAVSAGTMADTAVLRKNHEIWRARLEQLNKELEQLGDERIDPLPQPVGPESPDYVPLPANKLTHEVAGSAKYGQNPLFYGQVVFDGGTHKVVIVGDSSSGHMQSNVLVQELHSGKFNPYWVDRQMLRDGKKDGLDLQSLDDKTKELTPTVDAVLDPADFENDFNELIDALKEAGYSENDSHESVYNLYEEFWSGELNGRQTADALEKLIFDDYESEAQQADLVGKLRAALNNPAGDQKKADLPESDVQADADSAGSFTQLAGGPIPPDVLASLDGYALSDYAEINAAIRSGDSSALNDMLFGNSEVPHEPGETTTVGKAIENIKSIMARSTLKNDLTLYRGINEYYNGFDGVEVGDRLKEKAFASTTRSELTAENFHDGSGVLFVISAPKGANAIDVSHLFPDSLIAEQEVLLPTDSLFDVTHIEQKGDLKVVHVDLVHGDEELPAASSPFSVLSDRGQSGDGYAALGLWGKYGAAGVLIRHVDDSGDEKFLLVQRGPGVSSNQGKWQLPGGALDEHETPHQAAARETVEELGADPEMLSKMTSAGETVFEHPSGWKYTNIAADAPEQFTPQVDGTETSAAKWVNRNELDDMRANGDLMPAFADSLNSVLGHYDANGTETSHVPLANQQAEDLSESTALAAPKPTSGTALATGTDTSNWKKIGGQQGSNSGGTYEAPDGQRYYIKKGKSPSHVKNEVLATLFYREAGIDIPEVTEVVHNGDVSVASKLIPGAKQDLLNHISDDDYLDKIREGFAMDAFLANWDVAGLVHDNIVTDENGNPFRVDTGGALIWRAQGAPKGAAFGPEVKELDTLRDGMLNTAGDLFEGMTNQQLVDSAERVRAITSDRIDALVDSVNLDPVESAHLAQTLKARREYILDKLGVPDTPPNSDEISAPDETMAPVLNPDDWNSLPAWEQELLHGSKMDPSYDPSPDAPAPTNLDPPISGTTVDEIQAAADKLVASLGLSSDGKTKIEVGHKVTTNKGESGTVVKDNVNPNYFFVKFDTGPKAGQTLARSTKTLTIVNASNTESTPAPSPSAPAPAEPLKFGMKLAHNGVQVPATWTQDPDDSGWGTVAYFKDAYGYSYIVQPDGSTHVTTPDGEMLVADVSPNVAFDVAKDAHEHAMTTPSTDVPEGWMQTAPPSASGTRYFKDEHGNSHVIYSDGTVYSYDSDDKTIGAFDNAVQAKNKADALANASVATDQYGLNPAPYTPQGRTDQESSDYTDYPQDLLDLEGADRLEELFQEALDGNHKSIMIKFDYEEYVPTEAVRDALVLAGRIQPPHAQTVSPAKSHPVPSDWISTDGPETDPHAAFYKNAAGFEFRVAADGKTFVVLPGPGNGFLGTYDSPSAAVKGVEEYEHLSNPKPTTPSGPSLGATKSGDQLYPGSKVQYIKKDFGKIGGTVVSRSAYNDKMIVIKPDNFSGTHTTHVDNIELDHTKTQTPAAPAAPAPTPTGPSWVAAGGKQMWVGTEVKDSKGQAGRVVSGTTSPEYVKVRITSGPQTGKVVARSRTKLTPTGGVGHGQNAPTLPPGADPALVGKPRPQPPASPSLTSTPHVSDEWMASAKAHYDTLLKGKPLEQSNTWPRFVRVRDEGSQADLDHLHNIGYITDQQHADGTAQLTKQKEANDQILITHGQAMKKYQEDLKAWALANGNTLDSFDAATFVPKGMTGAKQFGSHWDGDQYAKDHWLTASKYPAAARAAVKKYVGSSSYANPPLWNLAETSRVSLGSLDAHTRKHIQDLDQAMEFATRIPEDMILIRGTDSSQFGLPYSADPASLIGQVKTNFGFTSTSASDHPGLSNSYEMRIRVPKGYKAVGVAGNDFGSHNEAEILLPRDTSFYIHNAYANPNGHGWVIDAEVVPPGWEPENHLASKQSGLNY